MGFSTRRKWLKDKERKVWLDSLKPGDKVKFCYSENSLPSFEVEVTKKIGKLIEVKNESGNFFLLSKKTGADEPIGKHTYMFILPSEDKAYV